MMHTHTHTNKHTQKKTGILHLTSYYLEICLTSNKQMKVKVLFGTIIFSLTSNNPHPTPPPFLTHFSLLKVKI